MLTNSDDKTISAVLTHAGRILVEQPDGSFRAAKSRTDWRRIDAMSEEEIERNAAEEMAGLGIGPDWPDHARLVLPRPTTRITMRLDPEVLGFFEPRGKGGRSRMQAVQRFCVEVQLPSARSSAHSHHGAVSEATN